MWELSGAHERVREEVLWHGPELQLQLQVAVTAAGSHVAGEVRKLFGTWYELTLESIAFRKEYFQKGYSERSGLWSS